MIELQGMKIEIYTACERERGRAKKDRESAREYRRMRIRCYSEATRSRNMMFKIMRNRNELVEDARSRPATTCNFPRQKRRCSLYTR